MIYREFERCVNVFSGRIALSFEDRNITYAELDRMANQLARRLVDEGITSNGIVGLLMTRSPEWVISTLAIWKAGGAYLPIDPANPEERILYYLRESKPDLILTNQPSFKDRNEPLGIKFLVLDNCTAAEYSDMQLGSICCEDSLAYILFTSGSAGKPKGVMIEQRNITAFFHGILSRVKPNLFPCETWMAFHSISFDFSVWEVWGALLTGAKLLILTDEQRKDVRKLARLLAKEQVTILSQTPTAFHVLQKYIFQQGVDMSSVRQIFFSGDKLDFSLLTNWAEHYPRTKLINLYGITETTVMSTYKEILPEDMQTCISNIGTALSGSKIFLLNDRQECVLPGEKGEIYVEGPSVARGYLNRPSETQERFLQSPFCTGERLYRSGDMARLLPSGDLEFLGRNDRQVKVRGYRIELDEIERIMANLDPIEQAFAMLYDSGKSIILCAVYTGGATETEVGFLLKDSLPQYMVPALLLKVEQFPLTNHGKIDQQKLADQFHLIESQKSVGNILFPPPFLNRVFQLIQDVLPIADLSISPDQTMSDLGFDSISYINFVVSLESHFNIEIPDEYLLFNELHLDALIEYVRNRTNAISK